MQHFQNCPKKAIKMQKCIICLFFSFLLSFYANIEKTYLNGNMSRYIKSSLKYKKKNQLNSSFRDQIIEGRRRPLILFTN